MDLAKELGMALQEVKQKTTSTEFVKWQIHQEMSWNRPSRSDFYLAQIAREVRIVLMKAADANRQELKKFILKFVDKKKKKQKPVEEPIKRIDWDEEENEVHDEQFIEDKTAMSKAFWLNLTGKKKEEIQNG